MYGFYGLEHHTVKISGDVTDAGRTNDKRRTTREDRATQPMDAGWLSFAKMSKFNDGKGLFHSKDSNIGWIALLILCHIYSNKRHFLNLMQHISCLRYKIFSLLFLLYFCLDWVENIFMMLSFLIRLSSCLNTIPLNAHYHAEHTNMSCQKIKFTLTSCLFE